MILVESAVKMAKIHNFNAKVDDGRLHVWHDNPLRSDITITYSTLITDGMVSEMMLEKFIKWEVERIDEMSK